MRMGSAAFWAVAAGIVYSGCRIMVQNVEVNAIEMVIVGSLVQVFKSSLQHNRVLSCQTTHLSNPLVMERTIV